MGKCKRVVFLRMQKIQGETCLKLVGRDVLSPERKYLNLWDCKFDIVYGLELSTRYFVQAIGFTCSGGTDKLSVH